MHKLSFYTKLGLFMTVFMLVPLAVVFAAKPTPYNFDSVTGIVEDLDHPTYFYRLPDGSDYFQFESSSFQYGYGLAKFNGNTTNGYGYGYGYDYYALNSSGLSNSDNRLGYFIAATDAPSYTTAVLPVEVDDDTATTQLLPSTNLRFIEDGNTGVYLEGGEDGLIITGPADWDGDFDVNFSSEFSDLSEDYSALEDLYNEDSSFFSIQVTNGTGSRLTFSDEVFITLPVVGFDPASMPVYFADTDGEVEQIFECSNLQFTGNLEDDSTWLDSSNYDLDSVDDECYVSVPSSDLLILATRHFTAFAVGNESTPTSGGSSSGSGLKTNTSDYPFNDVAELHFARDYIKELFDKGIVNGRSADKFVPEGTLTRAELVKMVVLALGYESKLDESAIAKFKDLGKQDWFAPYVSSAIKLGLVKGYNDATFRPNQAVTRAEAVKILISAAKLNVVKYTDLVKFKDVSSKDWFADYVSTAFSNKIVSGKSEFIFDPNGNMTRGEAAKVVSKTMSIK